MILFPFILGVSASVTPGGSGLESFIAEGSRLPDFELQQLAGGKLRSSELAGKIGVVVFVRPEQQDSVSLLRAVSALTATLGDSWQKTAVCSGQVTRAAARRLVQTAGFDGTLLLDPDRAVYAGFGVIAVPSLAVFDTHSTVVYSRAGFGNDLLHYVEKHLRELLGKTAEKEKSKGSPRAIASMELARQLIEKGDLDTAESVLRKTLEKEVLPEGCLLLGEVFLGKKEPEKALRLLERARKRFPNRPRLEVAVARVMSVLDRDKEAEILLEKIVSRAPDVWEAHVALAEVYEKSGRKDLSIREYKKAIALLKRSIRR